MAKVNDIRTFLKGKKETDAPALDASATVDVSQSELMMVENQTKSLKDLKTRSLFLEMIRTNLKPILLLIFKVV